MIPFSIIIPVYNVSEFLSECIGSVLQQNYTNFEMILIDDGSTDNSGEMCAEFSNLDSRIRVVHQENRGLSAARNAGIDAAKGEYIIFLDSDDLWDNKDVLNILAQRIDKFFPDVISFNYRKFDNNGQYDPYFSMDSSTQLLTLQDMIDRELWIACAWNKVIKKTLFDGKSLHFVEGITSEDMDWCVRLALKATKFDYLNLVVVRYRQRASSISQSSTCAKVRCVLNNICNCIAIINEHDNADRLLLKPYIGYQYGTLLFHLASLASSPEKKELVLAASDLRYLLKWSKNWKVRLLDLVTSIFGIRLTLFALKQVKGLL